MTTSTLPPFQRHSETSRLAAIAAYSFKTDLQKQVYEILEASTNGLTDEEMQMALYMDPNTQRPRRVELVRAGYVIDSGRKRRTRSGRLATVWAAANPHMQQASLF